MNISRSMFFFWALMGMVILVAGASGQSFDIDGHDSYPSFLEAEKVALLSSAVDGIVHEIKAHPQDFVSTGDVILQQDTDEMLLKIASAEIKIKQDTTIGMAEIRLEYSTESLGIVEKLYETKIGKTRVGTKKELQEARQGKTLAELELKQARLELQLLKIDLDYSRKILAKHSVRSPFDGVVVEFSSVRTLEDRGLKKIAVGEMLRAGQAVAAVMKVDHLRVSIDLPIDMLDSVQLGQDAKVYVQGTETAVDAKVVYKSPTANSATMQFRIEVELINPLLDDAPDGSYRYKFRPGLRARIELAGNK